MIILILNSYKNSISNKMRYKKNFFIYMYHIYIYKLFYLAQRDFRHNFLKPAINWNNNEKYIQFDPFFFFFKNIDVRMYDLNLSVYDT